MLYSEAIKYPAGTIFVTENENYFMVVENENDKFLENKAMLVLTSKNLPWVTDLNSRVATNKVEFRLTDKKLQIV